MFLTSQETALKFMNVIGLFAKNLENLLFSEIVVIRQSSSECASSTSSTIKGRNGREIAWTNSPVS